MTPVSIPPSLMLDRNSRADEVGQTAPMLIYAYLQRRPWRTAADIAGALSAIRGTSAGVQHVGKILTQMTITGALVGQPRLYSEARGPAPYEYAVADERDERCPLCREALRVAREYEDFPPDAVPPESIE